MEMEQSREVPKFDELLHQMANRYLKRLDGFVSDKEKLKAVSDSLFALLKSIAEKDDVACQKELSTFRKFVFEIQSQGDYDLNQMGFGIVQRATAWWESRNGRT
jgi:hypothetical protein